MNVLALALLLGTFVWGLGIYQGIPDVIPFHWDGLGQADEYRPKSFGVVFGPLAIGFALVVGMIFLHLGTRNRFSTVPAERKVSDLVIGYLNLYLAAIFTGVSIISWYDLALGPWFPALIILGILPVFMIVGFNMRQIRAEHEALGPDRDPSTDPQRWILGGFLYSNPDDPRMFVPKPPHTGFGMTFNMASGAARWSLVGLLLLVVGIIVLGLLL